MYTYSTTVDFVRYAVEDPALWKEGTFTLQIYVQNILYTIYCKC